ncbi:MAG: SpoIIE family protein phosphatase [Anaerolineales bacterium]|nr:SpoIIE family protein phosphatase [Anaerolineales bacterium]
MNTTSIMAPQLAAIVRQAFPGVTEDDVRALMDVAVAQTYPAEHVLVHEGEIEHVFYILADGQAEISQKLGDGTKRVITTRQPGEFFGEMALIEKMPRSATVTALTKVTVLEVSEEAFQELLVSRPTLALAMIRRFVSNVRASGRATIADLTRKNEELRRAYEELKAAQAELVQKEKLEHELEIAGEVQRSLLPATFPKVNGYSFFGRNVPARHVGGDLYDVIRVDDEHVGLLMADVSDKSVHAALIMAVTRTLFLSHARRSRSPAEVAVAVHEGLLEVSSNDDMFVTVFYGVLNTSTGHLRYVRAGQDEPLLYRAAGGPPESLTANGRFLGMLPELKLEERETRLYPGDLLVMYSDGVSDAMNSENAVYGVDRLRTLLEAYRAAPAKVVCSAIFNDVFEFRGNTPAFDDITVLVVRCEG